MSNRTIVTILAVLGLLALVVAVQPVFACAYGCTPGYWRQEQHEDAWTAAGLGRDELISDVCCDTYGVCGISTTVTLGEAVWLKGGGENACLRHGAAALLNAEHPGVWGADPWLTPLDVCVNILAHCDSPSWEFAKDLFEEGNELGCPLD